MKTRLKFSGLPRCHMLWLLLVAFAVGSGGGTTREVFEIKEGLPIGTSVGFIPMRANFTYRFNEPPHEFELNATTGEIRTAVVLDRESLPSERLDLVVLSSQPTYPIEVRIIVLDANDHAPLFPESSLAVTLSEASAVGTRVLLDAASDKDVGQNGVASLRYRIVGGNDDGKFELRTTTNPTADSVYLYLATVGPLDREQTPSYRLNVSAEDGGQPPLRGYLLVNVTLSDANDNPPMFDQSAYTVSLDEGAAAGSRVLEVRATDADIGDNARLSYHLPEGETRFAIDPQTGVITTGIDRVNCPVTASIKLEEKGKHIGHATNKSCVLTVFARDHGSPRQDGRTYVTINLLDSNDHDPQISFRVFGEASDMDASVDENAENNQVVAAISVVDGDEGPNGETDLRVIGGNELAHFRLQNSGDFYLLRVAGVLDRERVPFYNLTVVATDRGIPMRASTAHLVVRVNDVNDHAPQFEKAECMVSLSERTPPGSFVESLTATDADSGINAEVFYAIEAGDERRWFAIDRRSGLVTTVRELDREALSGQDSVELKIRAHDGGPNRKLAYATLRVQLLDENDEAPTFTAPGGQLNVTLSENSPPHTLVAIVAATDKDLAANGSITYELHPSVEMLYGGMFEIDAAYGKLTTKTTLDREKVSHYQLKVIARDNGTPSLSSTLDISLNVADVNDNKPTIYPGVYFYQVNDGLQPGEFTARIRAFDPDEGQNAKIKYSIVSGAEVRFAIDASSGQIVNTRTLDVRQQARYEITVMATNVEPFEVIPGESTINNTPSTAMVVVFVRSRKQQQQQRVDQPTLHPQPSCDKSFQLLEDPGTIGGGHGREIGQLSKLDGAKYSIVDGDPHGWFRIDPLQAVIRTSGTVTIDRETSSFVDLLIVANTLANFTTCTARIHIEDVNDNPPVFARPYVEIRVPESFAVGLELFLSQAKDIDDGDNARISYSLEDSSDGLFAIDQDNGILVLTRSLHDHAGRIIQIDIIATDGGNPPMSARQRVLLAVVDVNDHTPTFDQASYETSLPELMALNERFFTVHASDGDIGDNGRVSYNISSGNEDLRFGIFPDGQLFVRRPLDREQHELYELVVTAFDNGTRPRNSSVTVVVHVLDDNDNAPRFEGYDVGAKNMSFHIVENLPPDSYVGTLVASDDDSGRNAELSFSLAAAHLSDFSVDTKSGVIRTLRSFDREQLVQTFGHGDLTLEVTVCDNGVPRLSATARVVVHIDDENDNAPTFSRLVYKVSLSEATPLRAQVARVSASDPDSGVNGLVYYALVGKHADAFSVDEQSGQIFLAARLDRERQAEFSLTVVASDAAPPTLRRSAMTMVRVTVLDENDCAPVFRIDGPANYSQGAEVPEDAELGIRIHQFAATDDDLGVNGEVSFSIRTGNIKDTFRMDPTTGILRLHKPLDYELHKVYTLNITASDGGSPRLTSVILFTVRVADVNDNAPVFPNGAIVRTLHEGVPADTLVATVVASDRDSQQNARITYALSAQSPATESMHFRIRPDTGALYTTRGMDRELVDSYSLTITAIDHGTPARSAHKAVTVLVEDVNDNAPRFISLPAASLPAEAERGHRVAVVAATDPDAGANGRVGYELVDGHGHQDLFHLDRSTGEILLSRRLPPVSERQVSYQLTVRAYDEASLSQRRFTNRTVTILSTSMDSDRPAPRFERKQYIGSVSENEPVGTPVLSVRALPSAPSSELEYYLTAVAARGAPQGRRFAIDLHTGLVETAEPLDREQQPGPYELTILVTDRRASPPTTANATVIVEVTDKNDTPPRFSGAPYALRLSEDAPTGSTVLTIRADDPDRQGSISFEIVSDASESNSVNLSSTGCSSGQGNNDHRLFQMDPIRGHVVLAEPLDRELCPEHRFTVRVSDGVQSALTPVIVSVQDTNDNPPVFSSSVVSFDVAEDTARGTRIGALKASDADAGANGQVSFSLLSDWGNELFALNPHTGEFTLTASLDYEQIVSSVRAGCMSTTLSTASIMYVDHDNVFKQHNATPVTIKVNRRFNGEYQHYVLVVLAQDGGSSVRLSATATVYVNVVDVNDNAPIFDPQSYSAELTEDAAVNSQVIKVQATDLDGGLNGDIAYSVLEGDDEEQFSISDGGVISTRLPLDRETKSLYNLVVLAQDRAAVISQRLSSTCQVSIVVRDVNDVTPNFITPNVTSIVENAPINAIVMAVKAVDGDEGANAFVEYSLASDSGHNGMSSSYGGQQRFSIGSVDGLLRVAGILDRERAAMHVVHVVARDRGTPARSATAAVTVNILDDNDHSPQFERPQWSATVSEMAPTGFAVLNVSATDADAGPAGKVRYAIVAGDPNRDFVIDEDSGTLRVRKTLDHERKSRYVITVQAEDSASETRYDTASVSITLKDVNDRAPTFAHSPYEAALAENTPVPPGGTLIGRLAASDADAELGELHYRLLAGDRSLFRVNSTTGDVYILRSLDRERTPLAHATIAAVDSGSPRLTGTASLVLRVADVNDNSPVFERGSYELHVMENQPADTFVHILKARDVDDGLNAQLRYSLEDSSQFFSLDGSTGELRTLRPLDRETTAVYHLRVNCLDRNGGDGSRRAQVNVTVHVDDQNDNAPQFDRSVYEIRISDNANAGHFVFGTQARDADSGANRRVAYQLAGSDAGLFQVDAYTGVVKLAHRLPTRSLGSSSVPFEIRIFATDRGVVPLSTNATLRVRVHKHDEFPVFLAGRREFIIGEDAPMGKRLTRVQAKTSIRPAEILYGVAGGNMDNVFSVNAQNGEVSVVQSLDFETTPSFRLWLQAEDRVSGLAAFTELSIVVTDVNDNSPICKQLVYNVTVLEEQQAPEFVTEIEATDADEEENGEVVFQLAQSIPVGTLESVGVRVDSPNEAGIPPPSTSPPFSIEARSGKIFTTAKLDRESIDHYQLIVEAVDRGTPTRTGTCSVYVHVADKNDNTPRFTRLFTANVTENSPIGHFVIRITSSDADIGPNAQATYTLFDDPDRAFAIDEHTGDVTVAGPIDRETRDEYLLKVSVFDGAWKQVTSLTIAVLDANDNAPEFSKPSYEFLVAESQQQQKREVQTFVGMVRATDRDKIGSTIAFSLSRPSDLFRIDPLSGNITSKRPLIYRPAGGGRLSHENVHRLQVIATDHGKPRLSSEATVIIQVVDSNNHAPVFQRDLYFIPVPESMPADSKLAQLIAADTVDEGVNAMVFYSLASQGNASESGLLRINTENGWLTLTRSVHGRRGQCFEAWVIARDGGVPAKAARTHVILEVTAENVHAPVFTSSIYQASVGEDAVEGFEVLTVRATDADDGINGMIVYELQLLEDHLGAREKFLIDERSGAVRVNNSLDYETDREYLLRVVAKDRGLKALSASVDLIITILDVNDCPPLFNASEFHAAVFENEPIDTVVTQLIATDADSVRNQVIQYSLLGPTIGHRFAIDSHSGVVVAKKSLDFEAEKQFELEIVASNPGTVQFSSCKLVVEILGRNEFLPKFTDPVFQFQASESDPVGRVVGTVKATDEDAGVDGEVLYFLVGASNERGFKLDSRTGVLTVARRLDREDEARVVLTAIAKNRGAIRGNDTDEAQVIISILDGNDPPLFNKLIYQAKVSENAETASYILTVTATDKDVRPNNNQFYYTILNGNNQNAFAIDPHTGDIHTASRLDREKVSEYNLTIGAVDNGTPPQTGIATLLVTVDDINDNAPYFDDADMIGYVAENEPAYSSVMALSARDRDLPPNAGPFTYLLVGGPHADKFEIERHSGLVRTTTSLDRETTPELSFIVEAHDSGVPTHKSRTCITVRVRDKNDNPSSPRDVTIIVWVLNNVFPGGKIAEVAPLDPDIVGDYSCRLSDSGKDSVFSLARHCSLHARRTQSPQNFSLSVRGNDGRHPDVRSSVSVHFRSFDDIAVKHAVTLRTTKGISADDFVSAKDYDMFVKLLDDATSYIGTPLVFSIAEEEPPLVPSGTEGYEQAPPSHHHSLQVTLAVQKRSGVYALPSEVKTALRESAELASMFTVGYEPCDARPCLNGAHCQSRLENRGRLQISSSPSRIITTPVVLRRPRCACPPGFSGVACEIQREPCSPNPCASGSTCHYDSKEGYRCVCAPHLHGRHCELKRVDACASTPCRNGGSCESAPGGGAFFCLCRPGFKGALCEQTSDGCRPNRCRNGGTCVSETPGATSTSTAGYRCACPANFYGRHCERSTFGFHPYSFMEFPTLRAGTNDISIVFATSKRDALLAYNYGGQSGGRSDFVALELVEGRARFSFGGARSAISRVSAGGDLADGRWHKVSVIRNGRTAALAVASCQHHGELCDDCAPGNTSCSASITGHTGTLSFNNYPLYLGGLPLVESIVERPGQLASDDFVGCVHSVAVNGKSLQLDAPVRSAHVTDQCPRPADPCSVGKTPGSTPTSSGPTTTYGSGNDLCGLRGQCIDEWFSASCVCPSGLIASDCGPALDAPEQAFSLTANGAGFVEMTPNEKHKRSHLHHGGVSNSGNNRPMSSQRSLEPEPAKTLSFSFRTKNLEGLLLLSESEGDFTLLELVAGTLTYRSQYKGERVLSASIDIPVADGSWHLVTLTRYNYPALWVSLSVDHAVVELRPPSTGQGSVFPATISGGHMGRGVHDFLDPFVSVIAFGGPPKPFLNQQNPTNQAQSTGSDELVRAMSTPALQGCIRRIAVNGELQTANANATRATYFSLAVRGSAAVGCSDDAGGALGSARDPLNIGVIAVVVFFAILICGLLASYVTFKQCKLQERTGGNKAKDKISNTYVAGGTNTNGVTNNNQEDIMLQNNAASVTSGRLDGPHAGPPKKIMRVPPDAALSAVPILPLNAKVFDGNAVVSTPMPRFALLNSEATNAPLSSEIPECYDLENASSIAPSDIDIVYHYKAFRDGARKGQGGKHLPNNSVPLPPPYAASAHRLSPGSISHGSSSLVLARDTNHSALSQRLSPLGGVGIALSQNSAPLARLSPSSEMSQQAPRILTLQDISGKPIQRALLAGKGTMGASECSGLTSPVSSQAPSSQSQITVSSVPAKPMTTVQLAKLKGTPTREIELGLTQDEIDRLNFRRNSSLVRTLDGVTSDTDDDVGHALNSLHADDGDANTDVREDDSSADESGGNESFTCSEFEYNGQHNYEKIRQRSKRRQQPSESRRVYGHGTVDNNTDTELEDKIYNTGNHAYEVPPPGPPGAPTTDWNLSAAWSQPPPLRIGSLSQLRATGTAAAAAHSRQNSRDSTFCSMPAGAPIVHSRQGSRDSNFSTKRASIHGSIHSVHTANTHASNVHGGSLHNIAHSRQASKDSTYSNRSANHRGPSGRQSKTKEEYV